MATWAADLSDNGADDLFGGGSAPIHYIVARVDVVGIRVYAPYDQAADVITRLGWIRFGDTLNLGDGSFDYWIDPIWINGLRWQWTSPRDTGYNFGRVSWQFSAGSVVHVEVVS